MAICRACVGVLEDSKCSIFESNEGLLGKIPYEVILALLPPELPILETDSMPKAICDECLDKLRGYLELKQQILNAHKRLTESMITIERIGRAEEEEQEEGDFEEDGVSLLLNPIDQPSDHPGEAEPLLNASSLLDRELTKETSARRFQCQFCEKRFQKKSNLADHLRLHTNQKPFQCEHCAMRFAQVGNYRTHLRVHTGQRPFSCPFCSKSYNQSGALAIHLRSHTNEKNYPCECGKRFNNSSDLKKHHRTHDASLKLACPHCERKFAQKVNLRIHAERSHPGMGWE